MNKQQTRKIDSCVNQIEKCINESQLWDVGGWEAFRDDIDLLIAAKRREIGELQSLRKTVEANIRKGKVFPWAQMDRLNDATPKRGLIRRTA